tara:strand:- start:2570 stop:3028 length:459 start_codon:yes stop_codon:yes gene_type:complete
MIKKKIFILLFIFVASCGYTPIYLNQETNFSINSIKLQDSNKTTHRIKNGLKRNIGLKNKPHAYDLSIKTNKEIKVSSRDSEGNSKTFKLKVSATVFVTENDRVHKKEFIKIFSYQTQPNKFELKNFENRIQDNLIQEIILEIDKYLFQLVK